jgi:hypothetical protein
MPIDPRIPLGVNPPQIQSPFEAIGAIAQLQGIREQTEARRLAAEKARQQAMDEAAIRRTLTETGGDIEQALPRLRMIAPKAALEFETEIAKRQKEGLEAHKAKLETSKTQLELGIKLLQGVTDQGTYDLVRPMIGTMAPQIAEAMGPTYDPGRVQQFLQVGLTQKDIYDRRQDALKLFAEGKANEALGTYLSTAQTAEEWNGIKAAAKAQHVPDELIAPFGEFSPANVARAGQLAISPAKREELAGQAATRAQAEAHQREQEAIARGQLAVSQGQLGVARAREAREAAAQVPGGVKLSPAQQEDISTMLTVEGLVNDVGAIDKQAGGLPGVGPIEGRFLPSVRGSGGATGEALRNKIGNIQGTIAKLRGGTSFTPTEQALLETYTPTTTDTDAAIRTKLATLKDFIQKKRENTLRVAKGEYTLPTTPPPTDTGGGVSVTAPNGKTYTFKSAAEAAAFKRRAGIS